MQTAQVQVRPYSSSSHSRSAAGHLAGPLGNAASTTAIVPSPKPPASSPVALQDLPARAADHLDIIDITCPQCLQAFQYRLPVQERGMDTSGMQLMQFRTLNFGHMYTIDLASGRLECRSAPGCAGMAVPRVVLKSGGWQNIGKSPGSSRDHNGHPLPGTLVRRLNMQCSNNSLPSFGVRHALPQAVEGAAANEPQTPGFAAYVPQILQVPSQEQPTAVQATIRQSAFSSRLAGWGSCWEVLVDYGSRTWTCITS